MGIKACTRTSGKGDEAKGRMKSLSRKYLREVNHGRVFLGLSAGKKGTG